MTFLRFIGWGFMLALPALGEGTAAKPAGSVLAIPAMGSGAPAAGQRVRVTAPGQVGTEVYFSLYLPETHAPGRRFPVIVEYTGNHYTRAGSTGEVKDAGLGYAIARAIGAIWVVMPFVSADGTQSVTTWWGDPAATTAYCLASVRWICRQFGGNPAEVFLCGFSRGAIGVNYLGLHDAAIADVWLGFFSHDHYDGVREWKNTQWGYPLAAYRAQAAQRRERLAGRAALVSQTVDLREIEDYLRGSGAERAGEFTFLAPPLSRILADAPRGSIPSLHTDRWLCYPSDSAEFVFQWFRDVIRRKPGTYAIRGRVIDRAGRGVCGVGVEAGPTHFAESGADGSFLLEGLVAGRRVVAVSADNRLPGSMPAVSLVLEGDLAGVDLQLP